MSSSKRVHFGFDDEAPRYVTSDSLSSAPSTPPPFPPPFSDLQELPPTRLNDHLPPDETFAFFSGLPYKPEVDIDGPDLLPYFERSHRSIQELIQISTAPTGPDISFNFLGQDDSLHRIMDPAFDVQFRHMLLKKLLECVDDNPVVMAASVVSAIIESKIGAGDNDLDSFAQCLEHTRIMLDRVISMSDYAVVEDAISHYRSKIDGEKENLNQLTRESKFVKVADYEIYKNKASGFFWSIDWATCVLLNEMSLPLSIPGAKPILEGTTYWIAAEQALQHAKSQIPMVSTVFKRYNIGESQYLVQAGFDESLIISGIGYLEQIHVFVSTDLVDEVIANLALELGKIFPPFSSVLFTETSLYRLPVFTDAGNIREFDELVLSTASDIYHTLSTAKSPLTVVSLSQASSSSAPSLSQDGTSGSREELNKGSESRKTADK
ncbi:hypothetical protein HYPSUDRAFT_67358 [Hypholoma sublateritium FD-334 SS-4]|uniref:Uncharacterized protein n=1 Tax=Hypholoma sublateritium (strain FD-334 SS-4) TaxID=945553 RepID=A0A0D2PQ82_HYPSF|nr:hypothetical protein HYPSUDRAFT_67358 [Hypholoma sublateritium FD-334 SS-4]